MNLFWPSLGAVALAGMVIFRTDVSDAIGRINRVGPDGVTLIDKINQVNITVQPQPSIEALTAARDEVEAHARKFLGMHPVALSYFIRSATCSLWNEPEVKKLDHLKYFNEISGIGLARIYIVSNKDTAQNFGGAGLQLIASSRGQFLMMTFGVDPDPCSPDPSGVELK
jgi:hypothetical protein